MVQMKIKEGFLLRQVAGQMVALPSGDELDLNMMIALNDTGAFLWERLQTETDEAALVSALLAEYDTDEAAVRQDVAAFVKKLGENGFLV